MSMAVGGKKGGAMSDINVTPMADIMIVLLIIFMVITPMLQRGKPVHLPQVHQPDKEAKEGDPLILSITEEKKYFIESEGYDEAGLEAKLKEEFIAQPGRKLLLKGDERLTFGEVRKLLEVTRKAGAKGIGLGVQEIKK